MNRYEVHQLFAHGAQARLFRATDVVTGERCLLKVGEASHQEAFLALDLNHPFIQPPIDIGILPAIGRFAAYRECADPPFLTWLQKRPKDEDFLRVILQMTEFLSFLHHRGFLYNDFKPDHFLIGQEEIKVVDLGLCARIRENVTPERFSGTFPYISPERLTGKPSDERSDIFAFGMMLLHSFSPDEAWNFSPSTSVLENLVETHTRLGLPWSKIISEMTAFEPSQRVGSAAELWERLLPAGAKKAFLFFPVSSSFSLPNDPLENPVTIIRSSSPISLVEAKTKILSHAWLKGITVFSVDFRATSPEDFFRMFCICVTGRSSPHLMAAIDELQKNENPTLVVFSSEEILDPAQRALLHLAMTSLSRNKCMRFVVMSSNNKSEGLPEEFHTVTLPPLRRQDIDQLRKQLFPEGSSLVPKMPNLLPRSASSPEQIFRELKRQLPARFFSLWPAIARHSPQGTILDRLGPSERKLLLALAIAGGSIKRETLELFFSKKLKETIRILNHLENEGALHIGDPEIVTLIPASEILRRYRKSQIRSIADNLLAKLPYQPDLKTLYYLALHSDNERRAAAAALRLFRLMKARKLHEDAFRWLWSAFVHHANIPTNLSYGISKYLLRTAQMSKIRKVLSNLYKRNGPSLRLADLYIDYFHRQDLLERARNLSARALSEANKRHNQKRADYFAVRLASLLILQQKLEEGEKLLKGMQGKDLDPKTQGLVHHFNGLAFFFRGKITDSINENLKAIQFRHRFRSSSLMNLGIGYGQMRDWENARKYLEKSIQIFTLQCDINRLSHACTNLANVLKETGHLKEARYNHYRSMYYARTSKHLRNYIVALENLAITYELEGKTNRSISLHLKSTRLSKAAKFPGLMAQSLTNIGLQYAYQGRIALGLNSVRKAIVLKKSTGNKISLANSYEYLGLVHALAGHYSKAQRYLKISEDYFNRGACLPDGFRVRTYRAIFLMERNKAAEARKLLKPAQNSDLALLDRGLSHFAWALFYLRSERFFASACRKHLHEGERVLRKAPSLFWLAKLLKLKADYFIKTDHPEKAVLSLQSAYHIFSKLGARKELNDFSQWGTKMEMPENFMNQMAEKLPYKVLLMIQEILSLEEPDAMISAILTAAMEFADMERAVLILNEDPPRIFKSASMDESTVEEIRQISSTALDSVSDSEKPFYCFDVGSNAYFRDKASILSQHILSIVCLPLKTNHKNLGILYLDSREGVETVAKTEMVLLEIFASIITIVLNNAILFERQIAAKDYKRDNLSKEFPEIMGNSEETNQLLRSVHKLLESTLPVLITGETGTGKELVARVLHYGGARKNGPFVAVNSSAFSAELLESELFGHEQGAFTGAIRTKKGLFEEAQNGTIFLDEIGEMPISMQSKLLRILQDGEFRRVGGTVTLKTNARVVLATHRELEKMMEQGKFRADLYYRISGVQLVVPALRERRSDIPVLATAFLQKASQTMHKHIPGFSPEAMELLKRHSWPGNVRQLKMEIERIVAFSEEDWISPESLDLQIRQPSKSIEVHPKDKSSSLQEIEKEAILDRLFEFDWNVIRAAKSLGLSRHGLYSKMKRFQIPRSRPQQSIQ